MADKTQNNGTVATVITAADIRRSIKILKKNYNYKKWLDATLAEIKQDPILVDFLLTQAIKSFYGK